MLEFKVNEYITLKLEGNNINIYVNGLFLRECKHLDPTEKKIEFSEENFWGYCSKIQYWIENGYDTHILHHELAFPLLERLYQTREPKAMKVIKKEIALRYESGDPSLREYLRENGYIYYLSDIEFAAVDYDHRLATRLDHLNIMVFGEQGVGRRTLVDYMVEGKFKPVEDRFPNMPSARVTHKHLTINDIRYLYFIYLFAKRNLKLPGGFNVYRGRPLAVILMFDITCKESFQRIELWMNFLKEALIGIFDKVTILLVGGKLDLEKYRIVSKEEGVLLVKKYKLFGYQECSGKTGENVEDVFATVAHAIVKKSHFEAVLSK